MRIYFISRSWWCVCVCVLGKIVSMSTSPHYRVFMCARLLVAGVHNIHYGRRRRAWWHFWHNLGPRVVVRQLPIRLVNDLQSSRCLVWDECENAVRRADEEVDGSENIVTIYLKHNIRYGFFFKAKPCFQNVQNTLSNNIWGAAKISGRQK